MPYPDSPFVETFNLKYVTSLNDTKCDKTISNEECERTLRWLCSAPKITSYRVNTLKGNVEDVLQSIREHASHVLGNKSVINVQVHHLIPNVVIVHHYEDVNENNLEKHHKEIIVDGDCGTAVLRGAHVYAPGVMAMMSGTQINDSVSIYTDASKKCKKGLQKLYTNGVKIYVGNGVVKMMRHELFGEKLSPNGVAVEVIESISGCPPLGDNFLPSGWALLQNIPSVLCVLALNPQPDERVLDMCASPGNKTSHIAELMQNKGLLVALDKTSKKVTQLRERCEEFCAKVLIFEADSTKIVLPKDVLPEYIEEGPPFVTETFDRILLDSPCSVLGKRPQLVNRIAEKSVRSYVPLQRRLFETAVQLLKVNGILVYSTCTITLAENEGIVAWALQKFKCLELVKPNLALGGVGWKGSSLTEEERHCVQRFGPDEDVDSVGFFFACFTKKSNSG